MGGGGGGGGGNAISCKPSQILQRRLGVGGVGLQRHDSSQSRGDEDRLCVGLTWDCLF